MEFQPLIKGIIIGLSIAAPIGPIGILCIRRTLANNRLSGLISGFGAATADGFYSALAAFGLTQVSSILTGQQFWFRFIGGSFLLYLGIRIFLSKPKEKGVIDKKNNILSDYASTFFLTIANPMTIISFAAIFAGLGLGSSSGNYLSAIVMVIGVVLGSALWWFILSSVVSLFRSKLNFVSLTIINRISGLVIIGFSVYAFVSIFAGY